MPDKSVAEKLWIKAGFTVCLCHAPENYVAVLGKLPEGVTVVNELANPVNLIQVFVDNRQALEEQLPKIKPLLRPDTILWVTYHKGTSKIKTDINRDTINTYAKTLGLVGIAMISVNDDWAALRLKIVR
jgi:hypothetical protein